FYSVNIQTGKEQVNKNRNAQDGQLRKEQIKISADGKGNSGRCKNKFNVLRHAGQKTEVSAQCATGIVKSAPGFRNGTGQFRIAKGKSQVHDDDKKSGDRQPQCTAFFQAQIPAEVHAGNNIADTQPPQHGCVKCSF